jgi:hypothetical protein
VSLNIVIGIGGTGAKVVEAILHLTAIGAGPASLQVGFVDQDKSNGNVTRAEELLTSLKNARSLWRAGAHSHQLDAECPLFAAEVAALDAESRWTPHERRDARLSDIVERTSMSATDQALFDVLYRRPDEQEMTLEGGYRAKPHIGALAMSSAVDKTSSFWAKVTEAVERARGGGTDVNLLLVGSVFGGTGAAGFPTFAKLLRNRIKELKLGKNVRLGGILMLPYFSFDAPDVSKGQQSDVARSEDLLTNAREATAYYHLKREERIFDQIFLIGWDPLMPLGYHEPHAGPQRNPALIPELIAALGAAAFFNGGVGGDVLCSARRKVDGIGWADLPSPVSQDAAFPRKMLGQMIRFSAAWKYWGPMLSEARQMRSLSNRSFYKTQRLDAVDYARSNPSAQIQSISRYVDSFLRWAATIEHFSRHVQRHDFDLWQLSDFVERKNLGTPNSDAFIQLRREFGETEYPVPFNGAVSVPGGVALPDHSALWSGLVSTPPRPDGKGVGGMVSNLFALSRVTA